MVMSNVFLIIYSPHQHLTSQGEPVFSEWTKEEGPDRELYEVIVRMDDGAGNS